MKKSNRIGSASLSLFVSAFVSFAALSTAQARIATMDEGTQDYYSPAPQSAPAPQVSPESIVRQLYQQELHREGDSGGVQYWTSQMQAGLSQESVRSFFRYACQIHLNNECPVPVVEAPVPPPAYTCALTAGAGYNCFRFNFVQTTGLYTCSNGVKVAVLSQKTCVQSFSLSSPPSNNQIFINKPGVGIVPR